MIQGSGFAKNHEEFTVFDDSATTNNNSQNRPSPLRQSNLLGMAHNAFKKTKATIDKSPLSNVAYCNEALIDKVTTDKLIGSTISDFLIK